MSALQDHLRRLIGRNGPITVARYMNVALGHPKHGYYRKGDPFGAAGDFITAPEISQMFGEVIGLWCVDFWRRMGGPAPFRLVEMGPGRGTLMADALRAAAMAPGFAEAAELHLVETSQALRVSQRDALGSRGARWHGKFAEVPAGPTLLIANEFLDALPIRQFQRAADGWHERLVDRDPASGGLRFVLGPPRSPPKGIAVTGKVPEGTVIEYCPQALALATAIAARLVADGGAALIIDYGYEKSAAGDTLQAVRDHRRHDVLAAPGEADLTAHVDFERLCGAARDAGARVYGPVAQGAWLRALGIEARAARLSENATEAQAREIRRALHRLIDPGEMGALFKVVALSHPGAPTPAGFDARP